MTDENEARFLAAAKAALDQSTQRLDELTVARLRGARLKALTARPRPRRAWLAGGIATAAVAAAVVAVLLFAPVAAPPVSGLEQFDLLSENDDLELYRDLDFYHWLAERRDAA